MFYGEPGARSVRGRAGGGGSRTRPRAAFGSSGGHEAGTYSTAGSRCQEMGLLRSPVSVLPRHKEAVPAEDPRTSRPVLANNREALLLPDLYQEYLVGRTQLPPRSLAARKSGGGSNADHRFTTSPHSPRTPWLGDLAPLSPQF